MSTMDNMKAMVFAAGYGQRLRPLTDRLPKAMVPVAGRPMIEYPLLLLRHHGITEVIVNLHHLGEKVEKYLGNGKKLGLEISYSWEKELLETGGGLLKAKTMLAESTFMVINCDVMIDLDIKKLIEHHRDKRAAATLVVRPDALADRYGPIETSSDDRIQKFLRYEAPQLESAGPLKKYMFTGIQVLEPKIFGYLEAEASERFGTTTATYPRMLARGEPLYGFPFHGYWQDLGTRERIREAEQKLATGEVRLHYL
jgi:NDP-sugar pyrophosphorylase family protein